MQQLLQDFRRGIGFVGGDAVWIGPGRSGGIKLYHTDLTILRRIRFGKN